MTRRRFLAVLAMAAAVRNAAAANAGDLIRPTHSLLESLRAPALRSFLAEWPAATTPLRQIVPTTLPVLRYLAQFEADAPAFSRELVADIARAASNMAWRQTYTALQTSSDFLQNYGWSEILGTTGTLPSEHLACGFLLLGPRTHYPRHQHEAEEIYIPLVGRAAWKRGDAAWHEQEPGTIIHHPSKVPHAMRTEQSPLLALYLWRSDDLNQKAHFVQD